MCVYKSALYQPKDIIENPVDGDRGYVLRDNRDHKVIFVGKSAEWVTDPGSPLMRRSSRPFPHRVPVFTGLFSQPFRRGG
jgi:hypothetical protein